MAETVSPTRRAFGSGAPCRFAIGLKTRPVRSTSGVASRNSANSGATGKSSATEGKSSAAQGESAVDPIVYQDLSCRYRGGDQRLRELSTLEFKGRPCTIQITPDGLQLVMFHGEQMDQSANYFPDFFVRLRTSNIVRFSTHYKDSNEERIRDSTEEWIRPIDKFRYFSRWCALLPKGQLIIEMRDPEGIISHPMGVKLTFRSDYYAKLFAKRMREAWGLVKSVAKPKKETVAKHKEVDTPWKIIFLAAFFGFVIPLILTILFAVATSQ